MDAVTLAAAVAIAVDASRTAALEDRERYAMRAADLECLVAQRMFTSSQQVPENGRPMTWESAFRMRHNDLIDAHHALRGVRDLLNQNDVASALDVALAEVGSADSASESAEVAEEESLDDDPVDDMRQQLLDAVQLPAPAPVAPAPQISPFSGRCFRLDM